MAGYQAENKILYGWKEIADYIGCSPQTARLYFKRHKLPVKKVGGRVLISRAMVEEWVERGGSWRDESKLTI